ncbi:24709_t:CDS:2, partial [Dentiscutata erythropus]
NHSIFVWDTAQLSILPNYKLIKEVYQDHNPIYVKLQVPKIIADINEQSLVPLIPGYLIFMFFGGVYCSVKLGENEDENNSNSDDEIQEPRTKDQEFQELIQSLISKGRLGLSVKIIVTCYQCQTKTFYGNEKFGIKFSDLVAAAGLASSVNCEEWSTMLCLYGITRQNGKAQYFQKQEKFFNGIKTAAEEINQVRWKRFEQPIMNFYTKSVYAAVAQMQNPDIISPTNNDLYIMQSEICVNHFLDNHNNCWPEVCWKVQNPDLFLADPNLIEYTESQANALKEFLEKHTKLPQKQSLITTIRTSMNKAFNRVKLNYANKKVDYAKSFSAQHGLAVLHNNNGFLEMLEIVRWAENLLKFSEEDQINIGKI